MVRAFPWLPPLQDKRITGVFGLHYFDSIMSELVPWHHSAMAFHLYRLLSALVPTLWLLRYIVLKGFPKYLLQYELSLWLSVFLISLPSSILQVLCSGMEVSAGGMVHQEEPGPGIAAISPRERQQLGITLSIFGWYLGLATPFLQCKAIKRKEVNACKCISLGC